jgi:hypothetical protein
MLAAWSGVDTHAVRQTMRRHRMRNRRTDPVTAARRAPVRRLTDAVRALGRRHA